MAQSEGDDETTGRPSGANTIRTAGGWLVAGAIVWVLSLAMHPPPPPETAAFMDLIADAGLRWVVVHWLAAIAMSIFVVASLLVLTSGSRLTRAPLGRTGWAVLPVASLWVITTAVAEATVIADAAAAGDLAIFEMWHAFAEGSAMGFLAIASSVGLIALNEANQARHTRAATPAWAAWVAVASGSVGAAGWVLGPILGIPAGGPMFVISSVAFGLWLLWFGVGLVRTRPAGAQAANANARGTASASHVR